ncbi:lysophospholipid acyltransferase family protein [Ferruginibacter sp. SUN002]|uniref:lysophospholipid acyltransferase family protein n=1 Tax=Ferruginibacter sp. SUN002 TaxID=2937789 RepID=UPI003D360B56
MYYIVYFFLYLFSLLPFFVLYGISSFVAFLLRDVFRYRRKVILENLLIAFPNKNEEERVAIAKKFYRNFTDTFVETIKTLSMSDTTFDKRCAHNFTLINEAAAKGHNIQLLGAHMFNWEYANLALGKYLTIPLIGVYSQIENQMFDKLFLKIRSKYKTILVPTGKFKRQMHELMQHQHSMYLLADQNAGKMTNAYWVDFFGKPAPFIIGPHKAAAKNNTTIIFVNFKKTKRGYYSFEAEQVVENTKEYTPQQLTILYRNFLENIISRQPENYLWSHRRWRRAMAADIGKNRIEG